MAQLKLIPRISVRTQARLAIAEYQAEQKGAVRLSDKEVRQADEVVIIETIRGEITIDHYLDWRKQFTWRNVFDSKAGLNLAGAARAARESGYRFVAFEGRVYFVSCRVAVEDTGLTTEEIEQH